MKLLSLFALMFIIACTRKRDKVTVILPKVTHDSKETVTFKIDIEPIGHGPRMTYQTVSVKSGETFENNFTESFQLRWIRFVAEKDCQATAWLKYE